MGRSKGHIPVRTCVTCSTRRGKHELVRFVLDVEGRPVRDEGRNMEGRGAYACNTETCMDGIREGRKAGRAFRRRPTKGSGSAG